MANKRRRKSVDHEMLSPLDKLRLNQQVKSTELLLSGSSLKTFRKLSHPQKREFVQGVLLNQVNDLIDAEIIDYFKRLNGTS